MWIWPLYLHVNQKSDDDDDDEWKHRNWRYLIVLCTVFDLFISPLGHKGIMVRDILIDLKTGDLLGQQVSGMETNGFPDNQNHCLYSVRWLTDYM